MVPASLLTFVFSTSTIIPQLKYGWQNCNFLFANGHYNATLLQKMPCHLLNRLQK